MCYRILCLFLLMPAVVFADDVHLKGGAVLSGRIVDQNETMISVDIGDGVVGVPLDRGIDSLNVAVTAGILLQHLRWSDTTS